MTALALILMSQALSLTVPDKVYVDASLSSPTRGLYFSVTNHLTFFFRDEPEKMLNSFSDDVQLSLIETKGVRKARGKAAVLRAYISLFPVGVRSQSPTFSCEAGVGANICRFSIGTKYSQRRFVEICKVKDGLITEVALREVSEHSTLLSSLEVMSQNG